MKATKLTPKELIHVIATGIHDDELLPRFIAKFEKTEDGCWQWNGAHSGGRLTYGIFRIGGMNMLAHRVSFALLKGDIPDELQLDHLCRNTRCVNPDHLEIVTASINIRRSSGPPALNAAKTVCAQGHLYDEDNTWIDSRGSRHCRACARISSRRQSAERVPCPDCAKVLRRGSLWTHRRMVHRFENGADTFADADLAADTTCEHDSESGDEGPMSVLGRWPVRWKCDGCGRIRNEETSDSETGEQR